MRYIQVIFVGCFFVIMCNLLHAQESVLRTQIRVSFSDTPLIQAIQDIEEKTSVLFYYRSDIISHEQITCLYNKEYLENILYCMFQNTDITYTVEGNKIFLQKNSSDSSFRTHQIMYPKLQKQHVSIIPNTSSHLLLVQKKPSTVIAPQKSYIITPYAGYAYAASTLRSSQKYSDSELVRKISNSEQIRPSSFLYGVTIQFGIQNMSFITGFGGRTYSWDKNIEETYTQQTDSLIGYTETITSEIITIKKPDHPQQSEATTTDTVTTITRTPEYYTATEEFTYSNKNVAHYISIPLGFSFSQKINKKLYSQVGVVSSFHLLHSSEGYAYNEVNRPTVFDNTLRDYFISIVPHAGLIYMYKPKYGFMIASAYSYSLTPTTKEAMPVNRTLSQFQIMASLVYKLVL
ncbi:MAG: DUF4974 domain-containing protein [Bacteroidales bacterium]